MEEIMRIMNNEIKIFQTAKDTKDKLTQKKSLVLSESSQESLNNITINPDKTYQKMIGFGGAFTEAAAVTLQKLNPDIRQEAINAYFHPETGINYSFCRTHINSCDFSLGNYAYCEQQGDVELNSFSIERDKKALIPLIKDAIKTKGNHFKLFASPWSPPAWMKTTNQMNHGGKLKIEYYDTWALYFVKYIKAYAGRGINIWGITIQNEPEVVQTWDSCIYTAEEERDFIKNHLGPMLEKHNLSHIRIMIWDHNKDVIYERAKGVLSDPAAAKYVWGVAYHWYSGDQFENLEKVHNEYPDKLLVFTEGCVEGSAKIDSWDIGERYGHDIIGDLNNWTVAWTDWNIVLDEQGGPNHVHNYCNAPIIANVKENKLYYENSYYYLGHFSKFIQSDSVRIECILNNKNLETAAFKNPDNSIIIVIMNRQEKDINFKIQLNNKKAAVNCLSHSIMTFVIDS